MEVSFPASRPSMESHISTTRDSASLSRSPFSRESLLRVEVAFSLSFLLLPDSLDSRKRAHLSFIVSVLVARAYNSICEVGESASDGV